VRRFSRNIFLAILTATASVSALPKMAITGTLGLQTNPDFEGTGFGFNLAAYHKFDEQILIGAQSGRGIAGHPASIPVLAAGIMRLPFGSVVARGGLLLEF
jgi:hypothetical protein